MHRPLSLHSAAWLRSPTIDSPLAQCRTSWLKRETSDQEPIDRPGLIQTVALHRQVKVTVVLDRVAIGVEKSCEPIAQGLVAFGAMERQAYVPAGDVKL